MSHHHWCTLGQDIYTVCNREPSHIFQKWFDRAFDCAGSKIWDLIAWPKDRGFDWAGKDGNQSILPQGQLVREVENKEVLHNNITLPLSFDNTITITITIIITLIDLLDSFEMKEIFKKI